jgi:hypothetical protein
MATFDAARVRAVAIELKDKSFDLYVNLLPIITALGDWKLNDLDPALPDPFAVKIQLDAYQALSIDRLRLEWVADVQQSTVDDVLVYPTPPTTLGLFFDETIVFDENLFF